jgi:hypothetical protein
MKNILRRIRTQWGFKPEGFDAELCGVALAGAILIGIGLVALLAAALTGQWFAVLFGCVAGWLARSSVPEITRKK